ncbi:MAG: signal peptidase I [Alphaproteobacteria bacterium]|nr:signal peptidase I [Alphaproteobacteria bacterium]MBN2779986.1 signal peptidase I [Alphaproteobacteria bacterium]
MKKLFKAVWDFLIGDVWGLVKALLIAGSAALLVRTIVAEPFHIPSGSMMPTLHIGDHLFVSKYPYGYSRYSIIMGPNIFSGRINHTDPKRGDIVIFRAPKSKDDYIKRLIGLPGDKVQVKKGILYLNGKAVKREFVEEYTMADLDRRWEKEALNTKDETVAYSKGRNLFVDGKKQAQNAFTLDYKFCTYPGQCGVHYLKKYKETLPNGVSYNVLDSNMVVPFDNTPEYTVPEKHYFVMGDNRDFSGDSRDMARVGFIPQENLIGRAEFIFFSHNHRLPMLGLLLPWEWPKQIRIERFFNGL